MILTVGISPCPNDTFQFDALFHGHIATGEHTLNFDFQDVETLNQSAIHGTYDILKLSYARYFSVADQYVLLQSGSALGVGVGPLLISKHPLTENQIAAGKVALPGQQTTAHFLFNRAYPDHPNKLFIPFDQIEQAVLQGDVDAGVIIHENRFTYHQRGLHKIMDLGAFWEEQTQLPIPLGGIAIKRNLPVELHQEIQQWMEQSIFYAFNHAHLGLSAFVQTHAQEMQPDIMQQHIDLYVNEESKQISPKGMQAVRAMGEFLGAVETSPWWVAK